MTNNLLELVNTEAGRHLLKRLGQKVEYPIVKIGSNYFIENTGERKGKLPVLRATFFSGDVVSRLINPIVESMDIAKDYITNPYDAFLHYSYLEPKYNKYPQIYLVETTFNPDAHPESSSVDGRCNHGGGEETWAEKRDGAADFAADSEATDNQVYLDTGSTNNLFANFTRSFFIFNTAAIAGGTVTAAVFSTYITAKQSGFNLSIGLYQSITASNTAIAAGDFQSSKDLTTTQSDSTPAISTISTSAYLDYTLNATGRGNVSTSGVTKLGLKSTADATNSAPTWASGTVGQIQGNYADAASNDPKLVVTYTPAETGGFFYISS